eukprot:UN00575
MRTVVSDFGLSRYSGDVTSGKVTMSNTLPIAWSSPESLKQQTYSMYSDIWSFGVMMWELLKEEVPHEGIYMFTLGNGIISGEISLEIDKKWDIKIQKLMNRMFQRIPTKRPKIANVHEILDGP